MRLVSANLEINQIEVVEHRTIVMKVLGSYRVQQNIPMLGGSGEYEPHEDQCRANGKGTQ